MPQLRRAWLALLLSALLAVGTPAAALAQSKDDNGAVAVNTEDGSRQVDIAFDVRKVMDGMVDQTNLALALAKCSECQTVAIAIQVVLVNSPVDVLAPKNLAYAVNTEWASPA
jgi:putative peptide zinc metalloprotease protein